jgi:hypothetical protein
VDAGSCGWQVGQGLILRLPTVDHNGAGGQITQALETPVA